jgi:very-short-patch-repair endonuclease
MASTSRRQATSDGQRHDVPLRSRDLSGIRHRGNSPLTYARHLLELRELIASVGAPCWACGPTAAALSGFDGFRLERPFHIAVPRDRSVNRIGHVVHRIRDIARLDTAVVDGIPTISATRTIIDLARSESRERLAAVIDSALRDRLTSEDFLHRRIVELRRRGRAGLAKLVSVLEGNEITRGGHSWLERRFLVLLAQAGLPRPQTQQVVGRRKRRLIRVDCSFPGTNVVVELLGYRFHRTVMEMQNDAERMNRMILDGLHPLQFTYIDVAGESPTMLASISEALPVAS